VHNIPQPADKNTPWTDTGYRVLVLAMIGQAIQDRRALTEGDNPATLADGGSVKALDSFLSESAPKMLSLLGYKISGDYIYRRSVEAGMIWKAPGIAGDADPIATYRGIA